jgi:hypothetical protein
MATSVHEVYHFRIYGLTVATLDNVRKSTVENDKIFRHPIDAAKALPPTSHEAGTYHMISWPSSSQLDSELKSLALTIKTTNRYPSETY